MREITKYVASDGREFTSKTDCQKHEHIDNAFKTAMMPLGEQPNLSVGQWKQHDVHVVHDVLMNVLDIIRSQEATEEAL
jgi:hypothetical protein